MRQHKRTDGYTLIEILIVVMIIGILLAIAVPSMFNASERARANACRANLRQIQSAKEQWALVNRRPGPTRFTTFARAPLAASGATIPTNALPPGIPLGADTRVCPYKTMRVRADLRVCHFNIPTPTPP